MTEYTWTSNVNPGDSTSRIWLRDRTVLFQIGSYLDLTDQEYAALINSRVLVAGRLGSPAVDVTTGPGALTDEELRASPVPINTGGATWREDFDSTAINLDRWEVSESGGAVADPSAAGVLALKPGTTAGAKVQVTSKIAVRVPFRVQFTLMISQRITNQTFTAQVTNAAGDTVASWIFDGVTSTIQRIDARHDGVTGTAIAAVTTSNSTAAMTVFELDLRDEAVDFNERALESTASTTSRGVRSKTIPEPYEDYYVRLIAENGGTAPASATTFSVDTVLVQDSTRTIVDVAGSRGGSGAARALPVQVANSPSVIAGASSTVVGVAPFKHLSTATTNAAVVKASTGRVYGWTFTNLATTPRFVRLYNLATAPNVGTTVPLLVFAIPANTQGDFHPSVPIAFAAGIGIAVTAAAPDLDATPTAAGDVVGSIFYV